MLEVSHNNLFVVASLAVALIAGFSGLSLTQGLSQLSLPMRKVVISVAAIILGWGIWSMHFVAMLGLQLPVAFYYNPLTTLISALTAILVVGLALLIVHIGNRTRLRIVLAGCVVGLGIPLMHYIGMSGMELCQPVYTPAGIIVALAASIPLSVGSFWICYGQRRARNILLGTLGFGVAVFAVHFIAMAGTGFVQMDTGAVAGPMMSNHTLAFGVTVSAFVLSGVFLLNGASFVTRLTLRDAAAEPVLQTIAHPVSQPAAEPVPAAPVVPPATRLPYESNARTHFIDAAEVSAIRAEGHYTILYAGEQKLFCSWSITEAESRLPKSTFLRTHRSYLVNPDHVTSFERKKDNGVCYFEQRVSALKVPVSRTRLNEVRDRLAL